MVSGQNWKQTRGFLLYPVLRKHLMMATCNVICKNCFDCALLPPRGQDKPQVGTGSKYSDRKFRGKAAETCEAVDKFALTPRQLYRLPIKDATCGSTPALFSSNDPQRSWVGVWVRMPEVAEPSPRR